MQQRFCENCSKEFEIDNDDLAFYRKLDVPPPTWCSLCRHIRRHGHINDYVFYSRKCDKCGKSFVATFPARSQYTVYCHDCFFDPQRDDLASGREYDPQRPLFEQFGELLLAAPQLGISGAFNENSDYSESIAHCKNTYLISECSNCEDCYYCYWIQRTKDSMECSYTDGCERCYQVIDCYNCYNLHYSQNSSQCRDSFFLHDCIGCAHCLFCCNLRHKDFYIFNKRVTKEEFARQCSELALHDYRGVNEAKRLYAEFLTTQPHKHLQVNNVENCSGDYVQNSKDCKHVFHCYDAEDCSYGEHVWRGAKSCMDSNTAGRNAELLYECTNTAIDVYDIRFCRYCWGSNKYLEYCNQCLNTHDLFACSGLNPGACYCILNRQYAPEEYAKLKAQIVRDMKERGEYGEFFPLSISLFGYNDSVSYDEFPLPKEEVLAKGWRWEDEQPGTKSRGSVAMDLVPTSIAAVDDSIMKEVLTCEACMNNYRIISQELAFLKRAQIPLPRTCPSCRHRSRLQMRNRKVLTEVQCALCAAPILTSKDRTRFPKLVCAACYEQEVVF
jgi:hypothetical protein